MNGLTTLTATQAIEELKSGEITPMDLVDAAAARIEATDPAINAMPTVCLDRARDYAKRLAASPSDVPGEDYLYGLPIAVKDLTDVAGVRTTFGSPIFSDNISAFSNVVVKQLERNGAIVIGKSNTPEFGAGSNTFNAVFGTTSNPWHTGTTCGGSSGGAAAALAAGQVWLATGSDLGGSCRIPASFCGVVGYRPSPGRVARAPTRGPFAQLPIEGPMARTVDDVALMLDAQVGFYPEDPVSLPKPAVPFKRAVAEAKLPARVAFSPDLGIAPVDGEVKELCRQAAELFAGAGTDVAEECIDLNDAGDIFQVMRALSFATGLGPLLETHRELLKDDVIWNIEKGLALSIDEIGRAQRAHANLYQRACDFFDTYDLLLCPTVLTPPFDHRIRWLKHFGETEFETYVDWLIMTSAITVTTCPAISVPCGFTESGLPVGLQIVGPPRGDHAVLAAAKIYETMNPQATRTPIDPTVRQIET